MLFCHMINASTELYKNTVEVDFLHFIFGSRLVMIILKVDPEATDENHCIGARQRPPPNLLCFQDYIINAGFMQVAACKFSDFFNGILVAQSYIFNPTNLAKQSKKKTFIYLN